MRCSILPDHVAVWGLKDSNLRLSALAAELLIEKKKIKWQSLRLLRHYEWNDFEGSGEPFTGAGAALMNSAGAIVKGIGGVPARWAKSISKGNKHVQKHKERRYSQAAQKSMQMDSVPQTNGIAQNEQKDEHRDQLLHGVGQGAKKHLPEPETIT